MSSYALANAGCLSRGIAHDLVGSRGSSDYIEAEVGSRQSAALAVEETRAPVGNTSNGADSERALELDHEAAASRSVRCWIASSRT